MRLTAIHRLGLCHLSWILGMLFFGCQQEQSKMPAGFYLFQGAIQPRSALDLTVIFPKVVDFRIGDSVVTAKQIPDRQESAGYLSSVLSIRFNFYHNYLNKGKTGIDTKSQAILSAQLEEFKQNYSLFQSYHLNPDSIFYSVKQTVQIADSIIRSDPKYTDIFNRSECYWILLSKSENLIGPLNFTEFIRKCDSLGLPTKLKFK